MAKQTAIETVRQAMDLIIKIMPRATDRQQPKLDAQFSVMHADAIDRRTGLTAHDEESAGLSLAREIVAAAG